MPPTIKFFGVFRPDRRILPSAFTACSTLPCWANQNVNALYLLHGGGCHPLCSCCTQRPRRSGIIVNWDETASCIGPGEYAQSVHSSRRPAAACPSWRLRRPDPRPRRSIQMPPDGLPENRNSPCPRWPRRRSAQWERPPAGNVVKPNVRCARPCGMSPAVQGMDERSDKADMSTGRKRRHGLLKQGQPQFRRWSTPSRSSSRAASTNSVSSCAEVLTGFWPRRRKTRQTTGNQVGFLSPGGLGNKAEDADWVS